MGALRGQNYLEMAMLPGTHEVPHVWLQVPTERAHVQRCCRLPASGEVLGKWYPGNTPHSLPVPAECERLQRLEPDTFAWAAGEVGGCCRVAAPPTPDE